jgi:hypothetical protein
MSASTRRSRRRAPLIAGAAIAATAATLVVAPQAQAKLDSVSTVLDPFHGFPTYYEDASAPSIKLQLCVDSELCLGGSNLPDTEAPKAFPGNFPDEAFYAVARAETAVGSGRIRWRAVLEGAFANDEVRMGDQITFARVQVTGDKLPQELVGRELTFKTPYGNLTAKVGTNRKVSRERVESDPGDVANHFQLPVAETTTGFGPTFLQWDKGAPDGYIGNPAIPHRIKGGVRNSFVVFDGAKQISKEEFLFEVAGQKATP